MTNEEGAMILAYQIKKEIGETFDFPIERITEIIFNAFNDKDSQVEKYLKEKIEVCQDKLSAIENRMSYAAGHAEDRLAMAKEIYFDLFESGLEIRKEIKKEDSELCDMRIKLESEIREYNGKVSALREKAINIHSQGDLNCREIK